MRIAFVVDKRTAACLKSAGVGEVHSVETAERAEEVVGKLSKEKGVLAIAILDRVFNQITPAIEKVERQKYPIVLPVHGVKGRVPIRPDPLAEMIRRKVGIEVKW